ncbi:unnamed protein product [Zymoseptoria tritici ST99CH_3D7]|uniref:Uncharacterized protein n=1 Tax=Zymoseptoria tritici (strain ST99CH_3D7) TaxID=1276538 RepID=A0A1X7RDM9_ZYMT9|nr:unnamed protein product [Zymoseptoria tritici ST99CH_3D7]
MTRPNVILEALEPGGEPWLELTYEEGVKEIDAFWPSPELKPESTTTVTALEGHVQSTTPGHEADIIDGLMDDIDEIELLDTGGAAIGSGDDIFIGGDSGAVGHGNDTAMKDAFHVRSTAASRAASISTPNDDAPIASHTGSPELSNFDQVALTPTRSDGHLADRGNTGIPSSELRSSMQKEMHHEDEAAISVARAPTLPNVPTLTGLGHVSTRSEGDGFKSLEAPDLRTRSIERSTARRADEPDDKPQDLLADDSPIPSSSTLHKHGRKHARAVSILLETEDIHSSSKQSSPTRPLAKKPRRRGRTTSQSELQVDNEVMQEGFVTGEAERSEDTGKSKPQSTTFIDTEEDDSSLTDLTLDLDQTPPAEPVTEGAPSSELPSGQSWNFDMLGNLSRPGSDRDDEVEVRGDTDNAGSQTEEPATGHQSRYSAKHTEPQELHPNNSARKDSLLEFDPEGRPSSAPAESGPATAAAPSPPQEAFQSHTNSPTPRATRSRPNSRPPPNRKPPNREVAALMVPRAGAKGAGVSKSSGSRQTRGQKKAEKRESPNASKAAKKRHTAAVDYSKML